MSDSVWIVGQSLDRDKEGNTLWCKLGTFVDQALAESWKAYVGADILIEQTKPGVGVSVMPIFSEIGISVFPSSLACDCHEHTFCTCRKQKGEVCH